MTTEIVNINNRDTTVIRADEGKVLRKNSTAPDFQDDFVLSYVDFDVFHVVFTAYGD